MFFNVARPWGRVVWCTFGKRMRMKPVIFLTGLVLLMAACGNNSSGKPETPGDTIESADVYSWQATLNDTSGRLEMKKVLTGSLDSLSVPAVIRYMNTNYPNVLLKENRQSHDTLFLDIPEATYLTQQMGSSGPTMYFAEAVYNFTEIPGIRFVDFQFEEGDHAQPGTFGRDNFKDE